MLESSCYDFALNVREFCVDDANHVLVTLGDGSYINQFEIAEYVFDAHILVERYSSISWNINFSIGLNHDYRKVSTYHIEMIESQLKKLPPPPEKIFLKIIPSTQSKLLSEMMFRLDAA